MNLYDKALEEAVGLVLSASGGMTTEQVIESLERDEVLGMFLIWEPFIGYSGPKLLEIIDGFRAQLERFGNELLAGASNA